MTREIGPVNDQKGLNQVPQLPDDTDPFLLSDNHKMAIEIAKGQIEIGNYLTNEQANEEIGRWLNK